jgi:hypothetical protein
MVVLAALCVQYKADFLQDEAVVLSLFAWTLNFHIASFDFIVLFWFQILHIGSLEEFWLFLNPVQDSDMASTYWDRRSGLHLA